MLISKSYEPDSKSYEPDSKSYEPDNKSLQPKSDNKYLPSSSQAALEIGNPCFQKNRIFQKQKLQQVCELMVKKQYLPSLWGPIQELEKIKRVQLRKMSFLKGPDISQNQQLKANYEVGLIIQIEIQDANDGLEGFSNPIRQFNLFLNCSLPCYENQPSNNLKYQYINSTLKPEIFYKTPTSVFLPRIQILGNCQSRIVSCRPPINISRNQGLETLARVTKQLKNLRCFNFSTPKSSQLNLFIAQIRYVMANYQIYCQHTQPQLSELVEAFEVILLIKYWLLGEKLAQLEYQLDKFMKIHGKEALQSKFNTYRLIKRQSRQLSDEQAIKSRFLIQSIIYNRISPLLLHQLADFLPRQFAEQYRGVFAAIGQLLDKQLSEITETDIDGLGLFKFFREHHTQHYIQSDQLIKIKENREKYFALLDQADLPASCIACTNTYRSFECLSEPSAHNTRISPFSTINRLQQNRQNLLQLVCAVSNDGGGLILSDVVQQQSGIYASGCVLEKDPQQIIHQIKQLIYSIHSQLRDYELKIEFIPVSQNFQASLHQDGHSFRYNEDRLGNSATKYVTRMRVQPIDSSKVYFLREMQRLNCFFFRDRTIQKISNKELRRAMKRKIKNNFTDHQIQTIYSLNQNKQEYFCHSCRDKSYQELYHERQRSFLDNLQLEGYCLDHEQIIFIYLEDD